MFYSNFVPKTQLYVQLANNAIVKHFHTEKLKSTRVTGSPSR